MSEFLKGQDLVNLGNAVRKVTGYREGMTVAQMTDLLNETDQSFAAWDKSTGISITKSQVSDFSHTHIKADITDFAHNHDDRYYTEEETNTLLDAKLNISLKGAVNGLAELGSDGKVLSGQLPSYVDDVLEYANLTAFPANGESGKIYIALDTNKTYRWSGSGYTEISASLALGETSSTAGRGDWTKTARDHTLLTNNPHSVTKAQVGLENVDNTSDADKPISDATETALDNKVDKVEGKGLSANDFTNNDKNKLDGIEAGAEVNTVLSVAGKTGSVLLDKEDVGLENVDNTADLAKPISTATQTALNLKADKTELTQLQADIATKVDKVSGKGLSTNDYTTTEKNKLAGIASGAEVNVQSDWNAISGDALILNKPYIPSKVSDLTNDTGYITGYTETDPIFTAWNKSTGISITKSQVSDLIEATQALSGLMSATDKQRLDVLHSLLEEDTENSVVDSINEILAIFNNYPEGADLVTALAGKVDKVTGKGLSTNDLTNTLKSNYDTAYSWGNHAVEGYLKAITKAMVEAVLTGTITSHNHNGVYEPANSNIQSHISSISNPHNVSKSQVGLGNVDNTSDLDKPISTAQQTALDNKVDKVAGKALSTNDYTNNDKQSVEKIPTIEQDILDLESGKVDKVSGMGLSSNDFTTTEKNKLSGIQAGAQVNAVTTVAGRTGAVVLTKADVGLGNVDNTSDGTKYVQGLRETRANVNTKIWAGTQAQYDAIVTKDATTLYFITE